jgi:hypothetical protein
VRDVRENSRRVGKNGVMAELKEAFFMGEK